MKSLENPLSSKKPSKRLFGSKRTELTSVVQQSVEEDLDKIIYEYDGVKLDRKSYKIIKVLERILVRDVKEFGVDPEIEPDTARLRIRNILRERGAVIEKSLRRLHLVQKKLSDDDIVELAEVLKNSQVRELYLATNHIGDDGAIAIAKILKETEIQILSLQRNYIGDEGAKALLKNLEGSTVYDLDLSTNNNISTKVKSEFKKMESVNLRIHI